MIEFDGNTKGSEMDALAELEARIEIQELAARYGDNCDQKDWDGVVALFTPDGEFDAEGVYGRTMRGPEEIKEFFVGAPVAVAHHPTSLHTTFTGDDSGTTRIKMLVVFSKFLFSVDYSWDMRRYDGAWRIARQSITVVGKAPFAAAVAPG